MTKIKLTIAYDGTDFHGFARQRGLRTVQGVLEGLLERVLGYPVEVFGSGRTDAGVHARAQVVHFEQVSGPPAERYAYLLNRSLPADIIAISAEQVDSSFHARFDAVAKTYRYTLQRSRIEDIFTRRFVWQVPFPLDVEKMREAALVLMGEHDFTSFCAASTPIEDKRRRIFDVTIRERDSYCDILCTGSGFLQHMVRIITGTLVHVGQGRIPVDAMPTILASRDRTKAGPTAPAMGLTMWKVHYAPLPSHWAATEFES